LRITCIRDFYELALDDAIITADALLQHNQETGQEGLVYWIDIKELSRGPHLLELHTKGDRAGNRRRLQRARVEFYKSVAAQQEEEFNQDAVERAAAQE